MDSKDNTIYGYCKITGTPTPEHPIPIETIKLPFKNEIKTNKTAEEMFNELGYRIELDKQQNIIFIIHAEEDWVGIKFNLNKKLIDIDIGYGIIDVPILKAIYKMCEELNWLNE